MISSTVCDIEDWENPKTIIRSTGLSPLKSLGQNFLIEKNTLRFICKEATLCEDDAILEIGPGTGALTHFLSQNSLPLMCVEYDKGLAQYIKQKYENDSTTVVQGDILKSKKELHEDAMNFINTHFSQGKKVKIISNLPYKILSPLLWILFDFKNIWHECLFLVQKEFAEKLCASIKTKHYTPLTIIAELYFDVSILKKVGPKQFWPEPNVTSAIIKITKKDDATISQSFVDFLKQSFSQRRKALLKLLKQKYQDTAHLEKSFTQLKINEKIRAEELNPNQLYKLYRLIHV
jgi:16S rRNA (adenine1518-N6/adenine1519-N6)-dimethyltransferase